MAYHFALVRVVLGVWQKNGTQNETTKLVVSCPTRISQLQSNLNSNKTCTKAPNNHQPSYVNIVNFEIYIWYQTDYTLLSSSFKKRNKKKKQVTKRPNKEPKQGVCLSLDVPPKTEPTVLLFIQNLFDRSYTMCLMINSCE
jgi:hypothetical protein